MEDFLLIMRIASSGVAIVAFVGGGSGFIWALRHVVQDVDEIKDKVDNGLTTKVEVAAIAASVMADDITEIKQTVREIKATVQKNEVTVAELKTKTG